MPLTQTSGSVQRPTSPIATPRGANQRSLGLGYIKTLHTNSAITTGTLGYLYPLSRCSLFLETQATDAGPECSAELLGILSKVCTHTGGEPGDLECSSHTG